jgi:hypothetical protein
MRIPIVVLAVALSATLLTACGGDGGDEPTTTTQNPDAPLVVDERETLDRAAAQPIVLAASDLPNTGWTAVPPQEDDQDDAQTAEQINACLGIAGPNEVQVVKVKGNDFRILNNTIGSDVTTFTDVALANAYFNGLINSRTSGCVATALDRSLNTALNGSATASSTMSPLSGITTSSNVQFAIRVTTTISGSPQRKVFSDLIGVRNGRFIASANLTYFDSPPPAELSKSVLAAMTSRISKANTK